METGKDQDQEMKEVLKGLPGLEVIQTKELLIQVLDVLTQCTDAIGSGKHISRETCEAMDGLCSKINDYLGCTAGTEKDKS